VRFSGDIYISLLELFIGKYITAYTIYYTNILVFQEYSTTYIHYA